MTYEKILFPSSLSICVQAVIFRAVRRDSFGVMSNSLLQKINLTMKCSSYSFPVILLLVGCLLGFSSCNTDDDDDGMMMAASAEFQVTLENVLPVSTYLASGPSPDGLLMPGESYSFSFHAGKGSYLSLATMFVQSNDLFYAFDETGLALYDADGDPVSGDVTASIDLWDAGTEVNEEPGTGANQAPRQSGPDTGLDENGMVQRIDDVPDGFSYPADEDVIRVSISHDGGTGFTVLVENISAGSDLPTPLAPGIYVVHPDAVQLFEAGSAASAGLEDMAEDGDNTLLVEDADMLSEYTSPLAPGVWVVHQAGALPLFEAGMVDRGAGLEALAEDGIPTLLNSSLASEAGVVDHGIFNTPEGTSAPGPILPGDAYAFTFSAEDGDHFNLATMLVHTNDLFLAFDDEGIPLFQNGMPISGEYTASADLWDAGTELNEYPGAGNNQPARGGAGTGEMESEPVNPVSDSFTYPTVDGMIKITIQAMEM